MPSEPSSSSSNRSSRSAADNRASNRNRGIVGALVGAAVGGVIGVVIAKKAKASTMKNLVPAKVPAAGKRALNVVKSATNDALVTAKSSAGKVAENALSEMKSAAQKFMVDVAVGSATAALEAKSHTAGSESSPTPTVETFAPSETARGSQGKRRRPKSPSTTPRRRSAKKPKSSSENSSAS